MRIANQNFCGLDLGSLGVSVKQTDPSFSVPCVCSYNNQGKRFSGVAEKQTKIVLSVLSLTQPCVSPFSFLRLSQEEVRKWADSLENLIHHDSKWRGLSRCMCAGRGQGTSPSVSWGTQELLRPLGRAGKGASCSHQRQGSIPMQHESGFLLSYPFFEGNSCKRRATGTRS